VLTIVWNRRSGSRGLRNTDPAHWLCRPGRADACAANLDATIIAEDGSMTREAFHADPDAPDRLLLCLSHRFARTDGKR
jgi:hypothetical protein